MPRQEVRAPKTYKCGFAKLRERDKPAGRNDKKMEKKARGVGVPFRLFHWLRYFFLASSSQAAEKEQNDIRSKKDNIGNKPSHCNL